MDNYDSALNWKTVFKKILSPEKSNSSSSLISNEDADTTINMQCEEKESHENVTSIFSSKISSFSCNNISEDKANQSSSFHEVTLDKKYTSEVFLAREQDVRNNIKLSHTFSNNDKSNQVPEWNKEFKIILGKNSSTAMENKNLTSDPIKEQKNLQKCGTSVNIRCTQRENAYKIPKSKDPEEEEVKKLFALSRMFKHEYHNLNDFDGAGVDIFKCDKNSLSESFEKSSKIDLTDESDFTSFVPVKGLVAKYIPYTTAELIASPKVPFIEPPWDDDLLM